MTLGMAAALAASIFVAVGGCTGGYSPKEKLERSTLAYYEALRWSKTQEMKEFTAEGRADALEMALGVRLKEARIVDYEIEEVRLEDSGRSATVTFRCSWHPVDETLVRETLFVDRWEMRGSDWYLVSRKRLEEGW